MPAERLFFIKAPNTSCAHGAVIPAPRSYAGSVLYEGELGVVIGKAGRDIPPPRSTRQRRRGEPCAGDTDACLPVVDGATSVLADNVLSTIGSSSLLLQQSHV